MLPTRRLQRTLRGLSGQSAQRMLFEIARRPDRMALLSTKFSPRLAAGQLVVADESVLGRFHAVCVTLLKSIGARLVSEAAGGGGGELPAAEGLLQRVATQLGAHALRLWLADALHFSIDFSLIRLR